MEAAAEEGKGASVSGAGQGAPPSDAAAVNGRGGPPRGDGADHHLAPGRGPSRGRGRGPVGFYVGLSRS